MSEQTPEPTPDEVVEADAKTLEDGWLGGSAAQAEELAPDDDFFPDPNAVGWDVGEKPAAREPASATGEPKLRPREDDVADAAKLGIDYDKTSAFLASNPGLEQQLVAEGMMFEKPASDAEWRANVAAVEVLRQRAASAQADAEAAQSEAEATLTQAIEWFENGEGEPAAIMDALRAQPNGNRIAHQFLNYWRSVEEGVEEESAPATPTEYIEREVARAGQEAHAQQAQAEAQAAQESQARIEQMSARLNELWKTGRLTDAVRVETMSLLDDVMQQGGTPIADPVLFVDSLAQAGAARAHAKQMADFHVAEDESFFQYSSDPGSGSLSSPLPPRKSWEEYYDEELQKLIPKVGTPGPSKTRATQTLSEQIDHDLFGREAVLAKGWNIAERDDRAVRKGRR